MTDRWKALGMSALVPGSKDAPTADVLLSGLVNEKAEDPVEGMILGVQEDLRALASLSDDILGATLERLAHRLNVAVFLLRKADGRLPAEAQPGGEKGDEHEPTPPTRT